MDNYYKRTTNVNQQVDNMNEYELDNFSDSSDNSYRQMKQHASRIKQNLDNVENNRPQLETRQEPLLSSYQSKPNQNTGRQMDEEQKGHHQTDWEVVIY